MKNLELFHQIKVNPFKPLGLTHSFFELNGTTIIYTWIVLAVLACIVMLARYALKKENSVGQYLVLQTARALQDQIEDSLGYFSFTHCAFIGSIFFFILLCNIISLIPFVSEPTVDLNTTLGLGIVSFFYVQGNSIAHNGLGTYLKGYLEPFFLLAPVNLIGTLSTVISISFRLFGNIFGGAVIHHLFHMALSYHLFFEIIGASFNIILTFFFVLFEGFIQAFVFSMLTLTYLAVEIQPHEDE